LNQRRLKWVGDLLSREDLDGFLISSLENIRYLSGFTGSDGALLVTHRQKTLLVDSRYTTQARAEAKGYDVVQYIKKAQGITDAVISGHVKRLGFESQHMTHALYADLTTRLPRIQLVPLDDTIRTMRARKDPKEIGVLRRAIAIAEEALLSSLELIRPGNSEKEVAQEIEFAMRRLGAEGAAFETILAAGHRGALPHGKASESTLKTGDLVVIDFGACYNGYNSDQTCTVCLGDPKPKQRRVYSIVKEAHDRAISAIRPGKSFQEIDRVARQHIEEQGYGPWFGHGLGHGVGLAVHEEPRISFDSSGFVETGMVFTVEPGIYMPGWGGVRIEDMVLVRKGGCEILTNLDKELRVL
jgi:Xaa-Pro aminopeptidase